MGWDKEDRDLAVTWAHPMGIWESIAQPLACWVGGQLGMVGAPCWRHLGVLQRNAGNLLWDGDPCVASGNWGPLPEAQATAWIWGGSDSILEQDYGSRVGPSDFCSFHISFLILILPNSRGKAGQGRPRAVNTALPKNTWGIQNTVGEGIHLAYN